VACGQAPVTVQLV